MKIITWILTIGLAASAWAQSPAPRPNTPTTGAPGTPKAQATPKPTAATQQGAAKPSVSLQAKAAAPASNSAAPAAKNAAAPAPAAKSAKPATEKQASASSQVTAKPEAAKDVKKAVKHTGTKAKTARKASPNKTSANKASANKTSANKTLADKTSPDKTPANKNLAKADSVHRGKRDPFVSPIVERKVAICTVGGKRCLFIEDLHLIGIVESSNGVIAVVANGRHTYFLREHDPLADGEVERITSDTITLRQRTTDLMGRSVEREVTRKIGMPAA